jgi:hypothetical protein
VEKMRTSEENEVLLENLKADVRFEVSQRTYSLEPRRTIQSVTRNFIFTSCPIAPVSLFYSCFSINRTNDRCFFNIRGYGASRELYGRALQPR